MKQKTTDNGMIAGGQRFQPGMIALDLTHRAVRLLIVSLLCMIYGSAFALETAQTSGWVEQTKTYNDDARLIDFGLSPGDTHTNILVSDEFPFAITPGNYEAEVVYAFFDDTGSIGGISAQYNAPFCSSWNNTITNTMVQSTNITISSDGRHLIVAATATDNPIPACSGGIGWVNAIIKWRAKCGGCSDSSCAAGAYSASLNSIHFKIGLGMDAFQQNSGQLLIETNSTGLSLATPAGLQAYLGSTAERINDSGTGMLRQVRTSQLLADIIVSNDFCYAVKFYTASNFSATKVGGLYPPTGPAYNVITIQNPDASTSTYNRLRINTVGDLGNHQYDYTWVAADNHWELATGGGLRTEIRSQAWSGAQTILTETNIILNGNNTVAFKKVETYQAFPWGETNLVQQVIDPDGSRPQTNTWAYFTNSTTDGAGYRQLKQITTPSGYWERYEYDWSGRIYKTVAQFQDAPITAADSQCRVTTHGYDSTSNASQITTVETLLGREISRSYHLNYSFGSSEIICVRPSVTIDAPDNLITTITLYTNGSFQGRTWKRLNPDGTGSIYAYATNATTLTTIVSSGALDTAGTNVIDGTRSLSVIGIDGNSISNATYDIVSGLLLSATVTLATDQFGRPTVVQYNDGTTQTTVYGCCGIDSQTDRQGITTSFTYDDLKRMSMMARAGIATLYTYDAEGRILTTTRQGTDSSQIVQDVSVYDAAGRLIASTNALNYGTTFSETNDAYGHVVKATTNPDGSTRIETHFQDGSLLSVTGTAVQPVRYEYGADFYGSYTKEIKLDASGSDTAEWTMSYTDMAGRNYKTVYASANGSPGSKSFYNSKGQSIRQVDPDGVTTLSQYNAKGEQTCTAVDMNTNGVIDFDGTDRISCSINDVITDHGVTVSRSRTYVWATNGADASNLVSTAETSVDGLQSWNILWNNGVGVTNYSFTVYDSSNARTVSTSIAPDGSSSVSTNLSGRQVSVTQKDANGVQLGQAIYGYDAHGRQNTVTDARNGTTTNFFNDNDQVVAMATPSPDGFQNSQVTTNILDNLGRVVKTILPDATSVTNVYYPNGLLEETFGSRTYPVGYTYDAQGRMKTMTTWTNFATSSGAAVTTWNYDAYRGFLTSKTYADGKGPSYFYTPAGRLMNRLWARGILTSYSYDMAGGLNEVHYSDSTPGLTYGFDRLGRQTFVTNGVTVCAWAYNTAGQVLSESYISGPLAGLAITNGYDNLLRRTGLALNSSLSTLNSTAYGYDAASRLKTVSSGTNTAAYNYVANSPLVSQIVFTNGTALRMTTTKSYDYLNRLTQIQSSVSGSPIASFNYNYNTANQRTAATNVDNSHWVYQYDNLGQVISGKKYWADGTPVAGQQFTYNFDDIGNRKNTASGGDTNGLNLRSANYTANNLNQYTSHEVPGFVDVLGSANSNATVTVNSQRAVRQGGYFWDELPVDNSSSALWLSLTNLAVLNNGTNADIVATNKGNMFVPQTPELFGYDFDGNLTNGGRWEIIWNAENRAISFVSLSSSPAASKFKVDCAYDYQGRRIQKIVSAWNGTVYVAQSTNRFIYDGWNLVGILDGGNNQLYSFQWGTDLSGSQQGAGGVGGLLSMTVNSGTNAGTYFYSYNGNGDVTALVNSINQVIVAQYEYDPFLNLTRASGELASVNLFFGSTKFLDKESGLYCYGYRYYDAGGGRWLNRDPMAEQGGCNLYCTVGNDPINFSDILGLEILVHATRPEFIENIVKKGLQAGQDGVIWLATPDIAGSGAGSQATVHLTYDTSLSNVKEIPDCVVAEAEKAANKSLKGSGIIEPSRSAAWGRLSGDYIAMWIGNQPDSVFKMNAPGGKGYWYIFKPGGWNTAKPKILEISGEGSSSAVRALAATPGSFRIPGKVAVALKVGGSVLLVLGAGNSIYKVATAENKERTFIAEVGGWTGAIRGWSIGSRAGAIGGAFVPGAGETGISEAVGYIGGGVVGAGIGAIVGQKIATTVYDWVITPGFQY